MNHRLDHTLPYRGPGLDEIDSPAAVDAVVEALYGVPAAELLRPTVAHVTAQWLSPGGKRLTLAINDRTPRSAWDRFVLDLSRSAAGAVVTTGATLRAEPQLRHGLLSPPPVRDALTAWRKRWTSDEVPLFLVLTSGRGLDLGHPLFAGPTVVFTDFDGEAELRDEAKQRGIEIAAEEDSTPRAAVDWLRGKLRGEKTGRISIEAGPSTARQLYEPPVAVDELLLSTYLGKDLAEEVRGPELLPPGGLERALPTTSAPVLITEPSGPWLFQRRASQRRISR
ncbi:MAG: hypothetical protein KDD11_02295 [Acidobacteria bacterium]|nr:hypothetical protein [Acidobacteriota bacterium]